MSHVLVTGGAGYIGSIAAFQLLEAGHDVTIFDDLSTGHLESIDSRARFVEASLLDISKLRGAMSGCDSVMHFGGKSLVGESVAKPELYMQINVEGSRNVLDAMKSEGVSRIVFSSSAATYGEPSAAPISEDYEALPTNPYGVTKLRVDELLSERARVDGFAATSLRYFNVAGALNTGSKWLGEFHNPETHLIPKVLQATVSNPLKVFGNDWPTPDGTCIRDYVHVVDLIEAHITALGQLVNPGHCIINLGSGSGYSVQEVISAAEKILGRSIPTEIDSRRAGDPAVLVASIEKAQKELNWSPTRSLESMIQDSHKAAR